MVVPPPKQGEMDRGGAPAMPALPDNSGLAQMYCRGVNILQTSRSDAAAAPWIFRGDY